MVKFAEQLQVGLQRWTLQNKSKKVFNGELCWTNTNRYSMLNFAEHIQVGLQWLTIAEQIQVGLQWWTLQKKSKYVLNVELC